MDKKLEKKWKKFTNSTDRNKLDILVKLSEQDKSDEIAEFLFRAIEQEKYEKIRIKAIMILKEYDDEKIVDKLSIFYGYEREKSVRLALVEAIGNMSSSKVEDLLQNVIEKDDNDIVRSMAIKNLHNRKKIGKAKMRNVLHDVIQNDHDVFPKQMALSVIEFYANNSSLEILQKVFNREVKFKMRSLIYKTLSTIATKLKKELDVEEPKEETFEKTDKKEKKRRKKKKKEEEEHLFF
jgi:hypothetical protein